MVTVMLRPGRERPVHLRHPWVFSGAIAAVHGQPVPGGLVEVQSAAGEWLARGTWSSTSQIRVRLFTWEYDEPLDDDLLRRRLQRAIAGRRISTTAPTHPPACRLVYAESDGLPGLIVDQYGDYLVMQLLTQGMALRAEAIVRLLAELVQPRGIYERSDAEVREKEGLPPAEGLRWGQPAPERLLLSAYSWGVLLPTDTAPPRFVIDLCSGQKTGFYLDQAANRPRVAHYCRNQTVLDCFSYTGSFSIYAASAGAAAITAVDSSQPALALLREQLALNALTTPVELVEADVFRLLRQYRAEGRQFDVVLLDPPKFAHSQGQLERATRGYKDINLIAMQLLRPGGILATWSCSGLVSSDLFQKVVFGAAIDARRDVQILERLSQAPDHPVLLAFPESEYLKGLICRVW